jgi:tetratricopeptide (TPR) repeat protein
LLEDLHWADDSSLDLIQQLESSLVQVPLLLVGATRPGFFERRPRWGKDIQDHQFIDLGPLSTQDSYSLVQQILHRVDDLPVALSDLIVNTAEGNPFYIEELVKMLIEDGTIQTGLERWRVELNRLAELRVPPTLIGVLQARIDRLPVGERTYLQRGAVFGRIFWDEAVRYLDGMKDNAEPGFVELAGKLRTREMIFEREYSTFENTREYMFKHALLRDVIYQSLLRRQRQAWHRLAANWLEQVTESSGRTDEFSSLIASHNEQAGERTLAAEWYWRAGQGAASRYANAEALHAFGRALELTPKEAVDRQFEICLSREKVFELQGDREAQLHELEHLDELAENSGEPVRKAGVALRRAGYESLLANFPAAAASAQRAIELAQAVQAMDIAAEGNLLLAMVLIRQGDLDEARKHAQRSLDLARQHGLTKVEAGSLRHLGLIAYYMGRHKDSLGHFAAALDLYVQIGDRQGESMAINNLGGALFDIGDHAQAEGYYARSLELSREIGDRLGEGRSLNNLGIAAVARSDYPRAEEYYLQSLQITRELAHRSFEISSLNNLSILALYRYQFSRAMMYQQEALHGARQIGDKVSESSALINLGRHYWMMGDYEDAYQVSQQALGFYHEIGDLQGACAALTNLSLYHCAMEQGEAAREHAQQALELAREQSLKEEEGGALHCLGEAALLLGEPQAAYAYFQSAVAIRQALGDSEVCGSQAGLARACLDLGDLDQAVDLAAGLLEYWSSKGILGVDQPIKAMLTCYQVLAAADDPRAAEQLEKGYRLLQECAANIEDETLRQGYLRNVSANRELLEIWRKKKR